MVTLMCVFRFKKLVWFAGRPQAPCALNPFILLIYWEYYAGTQRYGVGAVWPFIGFIMRNACIIRYFKIEDRRILKHEFAQNAVFE